MGKSKLPSLDADSISAVADLVDQAVAKAVNNSKNAENEAAASEAVGKAEDTAVKAFSVAEAAKANATISEAAKAVEEEAEDEKAVDKGHKNLTTTAESADEIPNTPGVESERVYINLKNTSSLVESGILPAKTKGDVWIWVKKFSKKAKQDSSVALSVTAQKFKEQALTTKEAVIPDIINTTAGVAPNKSASAYEALVKETGTEKRTQAKLNTTMDPLATAAEKLKADPVNAAVIALPANMSAANTSKVAANQSKANLAASVLKAGSSNKACQKLTSCSACGQNLACGWCATDSKCYGGDSDGPNKAVCEQWVFHSCPSNATFAADSDAMSTSPANESAVVDEPTGS